MDGSHQKKYSAQWLGKRVCLSVILVGRYQAVQLDSPWSFWWLQWRLRAALLVPRQHFLSLTCFIIVIYHL